jgi:hypothetical protein
MSSPLNLIQDCLVDEINKIPIIKKQIGDSGAIPVHKWRGSNLANELEAGIKNIGFGIIVRIRSLTQKALEHWIGTIEVYLQINDMHTHGGWGRGVSGMDVAWEIALAMESYRPAESTAAFQRINVISQPTEKTHLEKILITAAVEWTVRHRA